MNSMTKVLRIGVAVIWASGVWAFGGQDRHTRLAATPAQQQTNAGLVAAWEKDAGRPALQRRNPRYQIEYGDVIELNFPFTSDFNQTVTVQPDGYISLIGAGDLHVEGQTTPELRDRLREVYGNILHDPVITVTLKEFEKPYFVAAGEVTKPGKYDLRGFTTATQAVAMAGGTRVPGGRNGIPGADGTPRSVMVPLFQTNAWTRGPAGVRTWEYPTTCPLSLIAVAAPEVSPGSGGSS